ncbi:MAG: SPOR domain-containing protein [Candidatus Omnitrophica bacterium]|nr:SPOR domain-containing protein [Candidatus Omnitrophota bacterium]MDD5573867.1 SPOR domain-containing protein [Candidatus Omnitrophota bacterium]
MMNANSGGKQIEFDVFPKQDKSDYSYLAGIKEDSNASSSSSVNVVLSTQSIIILFICVLMLLVASFTIGVEKGKLVTAKAELTPKETPSVTHETAAAQPSAPEGRITEKTAAETQKIQIAATPAPQAAKEVQAPLAGYAIQVASLKSESAAKSLSETLARKGFAASVKPSGSYLVVLAGNYASREEAQGKIKELKKTYSDCFIKKI